MPRITRNIVGLAVTAAGLACSYSPHPEDGKQGCYNQECPDGYLCQSDNRCWLVGHGPGGVGGSGGTIVVGSGGVPGVGGTPGSGGIVGRGGSQGAGGIMGSGGSIGVGGISGTVVGVGGVSGAGGIVTIGGSTGAGGTTAPPNAGTVVTIADYQARGAMTGYGWIALGARDVVTDPTCSSPAGPITSDTACDDTMWSSPTAYCMSGTLPALPTPTAQSDYDLNWGIQLGINATPTNGGTLGQSFSAVAISVTGSPSAGLRAVVHRTGDAEDATYCSPISPGVSVAFTSFNTSCWDNLGTYLPATEVANLDQVGVQVPSTTSSISVQNLCVTGITFSR
jgi:hypothetical protein